MCSNYIWKCWCNDGIVGMKFHIFLDKKMRDDQWVSKILIDNQCDLCSPKTCKFTLKTEAYMLWRKEYEQSRSKRTV